MQQHSPPKIFGCVQGKKIPEQQIHRHEENTLRTQNFYRKWVCFEYLFPGQAVLINRDQSGNLSLSGIPDAAASLIPCVLQIKGSPGVHTWTAPAQLG